MACSRVLLVAACLCVLFSLAASQFFGGYFGAARAANPSAHLVGGAGSTRDPRGPVLFPPSAPGTETSGVRVGASGYGFVPAGPPRGAAHAPFASYW